MSEYTKIEVTDDSRYRQFGFLDTLTIFCRKDVYYIKTSRSECDYNATQLTGVGTGNAWLVKSDELVLPVKSKITILQGDIYNE